MRVAVIKGDYYETEQGIIELLKSDYDIDIIKMSQVVLLQETADLDAIILTTILYN
jgi:hypothetical protein